jgi:membrane protease YdiL (CAAX protease family)
MPLTIVTYVTLQIVDRRFATLPYGLGMPVRTVVAGGSVLAWCLVAITRRTNDACSIFRTMPDRAGWALIPPLIVSVVLVRLAWVFIALPNAYDVLGVTRATPVGDTRAPLSVALDWFTDVFFLPVVEEIVFRGLLFRKWRARFGAGNAALWSTAAFAVIHSDVVGIGIAGFTKVLLYTRTRSLCACIVVHCIGNAIVQLMNIDGQASVRAAVADHPLVILALAALSIAWLARFVRTTWPTLGAPLPPDITEPDALEGKVTAAAV